MAIQGVQAVKKFFSGLLLFGILFLQNASMAETVAFNVKTLKYHKLGCIHAQKCTVNCIKVEKEKAKARGGIPCKVCGG